MVTILLLSLVPDEKKTRFAGHFYDHEDVPVQHGAHHPMEHNQGFTWSHWTSPSEDYMRRITPACPSWSGFLPHLGANQNTPENVPSRHKLLPFFLILIPQYVSTFLARIIIITQNSKIIPYHTAR